MERNITIFQEKNKKSVCPKKRIITQRTMQFIPSVLCCFHVLAVSFSVYGQSLNQQWQEWKQQHEKIFATEQEETRRLGIWMNNMAAIEEHNLQNHSFTLKMNHFGDLTQEEFHQMYLSVIDSQELEDMWSEGELHVNRNVSLPSSLDWREKGWVAQIKNQGSCESSWAFAATGALEAQNKRVSKNLVYMSEQQLIDCSWNYGNRGCNGGHANYAFKYIHESGGICSQNSYPYLGYVWHCTEKYCSQVTQDYGYVNVQSGCESSLQNAVYSIGPVSAAIDASSYTYQFYSGGLFYDDSCSTNRLSHALLIVGYDSYNGIPYWILKNSWGRSWGESGYMRILRNDNNMCGIATAASYPKMSYM